MLQVATQNMDAVKTDFPSKSKTHKTDCNEKFEDYLSSIMSESDVANATSSGKGIKAKTNRGTDVSDDKSNEKEISELAENTVTGISDTSPNEETNQTENIEHTQTGTLQNNGNQKTCMSQMMPIMPMPSTMAQQYVDDMDNLDTNSSLDAQQITSLTGSMGNVSAGSSLDLQQVISMNSDINNVSGISVSDSLQIAPTADSNGSLSISNSPDAAKVNVYSGQESVESMSLASVDVNQAEASELPTEFVQEAFNTEDFIPAQQIGESLNLQSKVGNLKTSSTVVQVDTLKTGEVATQNVVDNTYNNTVYINNDEAMKQTVVSQNQQMSTGSGNDSLKMAQTPITTGTGNEMPKMEQAPISAEKTVINNSESKDTAVISKVSADEIALGDTWGDTEQTASTESQFLATARVFSGKENDITAAVNKENIVNQVTNSIVTMAKSNNQKFTMELTPQTLGKITIEMKYTNGKLDMKIIADNAVTTKVLSEKISELKNALTANEVDVLNINVSKSSGSDSSFSDLSKNSNQASGQNSDTNSRQYHDKKNLYNDAGVSDEKTNTNANQTIYYRQNQLLNYLV